MLPVFAMKIKYQPQYYFKMGIYQTRRPLNMQNGTRYIPYSRAEEDMACLYLGLSYII